MPRQVASKLISLLDVTWERHQSRTLLLEVEAVWPRRIESGRMTYQAALRIR
jgi:hypothetical protein